MSEDLRLFLKTKRVCVIIPTYNNGGTVVEVARAVLDYCDDVFVVDDGSTDDTATRLQEAALPIQIIRYSPNKGKGIALTTGFREALKQGFHHAITLDADGQHKAEDIPIFANALQAHEGSLFIGSRGLVHENMPKKNTFANRFSNFWFTVQTGKKLPDTQTGFRLYPLLKMGKMRLFTSRYEAELELLVFSAWRNIDILALPIHVYYPPAEERISHFRPGRDFARISLLNTCLCFAAILYGYPSMLIRRLINLFKKSPSHT